MKVILLAVIALLFLSVPVKAQSPVASASKADAGCLIVKHKGTLGRRLLFTALIGLPIAPGAKYDLVEAVRVPAAKMAYKGKELEFLQTAGVRVIVLETKYRPEDLQAARASCEPVPIEKKP